MTEEHNFCDASEHEQIVPQISVPPGRIKFLDEAHIDLLEHRREMYRLLSDYEKEELRDGIRWIQRGIKQAEGYMFDVPESKTGRKATEQDVIDRAHKAAHGAGELVERHRARLGRNS